MKKILILLAVALGVLCYGSVAMAEGFTVYADYGQFSDDLSPFDYAHLTIGGEYAVEPFVVGGFYSTCLSIDPDIFPPFIDFTETLLGVYGGYMFLAGDTFSVAGIAGYLSGTMKIDEPGYAVWEESTVSSIGVGLKGNLNLDPIYVSGMFLFGVSNNYEYTYWDDGFLEYFTEETDDVDFSFFELKAAYQFTEALGAYVVYRSMSYQIVLGPEETFSGFGVGVQYAF